MRVCEHVMVISLHSCFWKYAETQVNCWIHLNPSGSVVHMWSIYFPAQCWLRKVEMRYLCFKLLADEMMLKTKLVQLFHTITPCWLFANGKWDVLVDGCQLITHKHVYSPLACWLRQVGMILEMSSSMAGRVSYNVGACRMIPEVPTGEEGVNICICICICISFCICICIRFVWSQSSSFSGMPAFFQVWSQNSLSFVFLSVHFHFLDILLAYFLHLVCILV